MTDTAHNSIGGTLPPKGVKGLLGIRHVSAWRGELRAAEPLVVRSFSRGRKMPSRSLDSSLVRAPAAHSADDFEVIWG